MARAASADPPRLCDGMLAGPDLDACAVCGVAQCVVVDVQVLYDVENARVLSEGAHRDAMRRVADETLNNNVGAVGLERDAVIVVVNVRVLDNDIVRSVSVPAVEVLSLVLRRGSRVNIDVRDEKVRAVGDEIVPLLSTISSSGLNTPRAG